MCLWWLSFIVLSLFFSWIVSSENSQNLKNVKKYSIVSCSSFEEEKIIWHVQCTPGGATSGSVRRSMCIRIYYRRHDSVAGEHADYFHTFCSTGTRLFNNIVITLRSEDEARGRYLPVIVVVDHLRSGVLVPLCRCHISCLSVCLSDDNFWKPWCMKFVFTHLVYLVEYGSCSYMKVIGSRSRSHAGCNMITFNGLHVGSSYLHIQYTAGGTRQVNIWSSGQCQGQGPKSIFLQCKTSIGNNSASVKHRAMKFMCSMECMDGLNGVTAIFVTWPEVTTPK